MNKKNSQNNLFKRIIFENTADAVEILNPNRIIVDCNKMREQLTGHSRAEIIGKHESEFFSAKSKTFFIDTLSPDRQGDTEGEYEMVRSDNKTIPVLRKTKGVFNEENQLIASISYTRKIQNYNEHVGDKIFTTEGMSKQITDDQKKYRVLFEESDDAIFIMTLENFVDCNKAALTLFAGSREAILNASIADFLPGNKKNNEQSLKLIQRKIDRCIHGKPQTLEMDLCRLDKQKIRAEIKLSSFELDKKVYIQAIIRDITKQYQYRNALNESKSLFRAVVNAAQGAIIGINQKGICFLFNPGAEKIFLQKQENMLGKPLDVLIPERYREAHNKGVENIFKTRDFGSLFQKIYTVHALRGDGTEIPIEISFSSVSVEKGTFIIGYANDISARLRGEQVLKESEKKFRKLFQDMPDAIFIISQEEESNGRILDVNPAAERQSGYSRKELLQMNIVSDLCLDDTSHALMSEREKQLKRTGTVQFVEKKIRKDGTEYSSEVILKKITYNDNNAILSINRDVTEKLAAEEKILKLSSAFEQSPVFFMITDSQGKIEYVNNQATGIIGYGQEELIGKYFRHENFPAFPKEEFKKLWSALKNGNYWRSEFQMNNNNQELFVSAGVFPIKNEQDEIVNYLGIIEDRSEQQLLRDQLFQIQKMDSIGALTGGIAHDFNNLLTVINGYSELASNIISKDEKAYKYIKTIFSAGEKASRLVGQLLAFTRQQVLDIKVIDLNTIINELNKMITRLIGADIHFEVDLEAGLPPIKADPVQIEQILINLIVNAKDAINESNLPTAHRRLKINTKSVEIEAPFVSKYTELAEGTYVLCTVSDSGIGMPKEVIDRIFEPFFTTKEKGRGTGLGLATVYGIVKQNKGDIRVYSVPGKGTTFKIYWPTSDSLLLKRESEEKIIEKGKPDEHILLVDDDEEVRALAKELLSNLNYRVTEACNGREAVGLLQNGSCVPNLLVTDLVMPEMDGMELAQKAKQIHPGLKILYASGFADDRFFKRDKEGIEKYFIQKPYTLYSIAKKIREVLNSSSSKYDML